jgi:hypothetical protein
MQVERNRTVARYEPVLSPDDTWMVLEIASGLPAVTNGTAQIGLGEAHASGVAVWLNQVRPPELRRR